jgi:hypothetical protein
VAVENWHLRVYRPLSSVCAYLSTYNVLFMLKVILAIHAADSSCWPISSSKTAFYEGVRQFPSTSSLLLLQFSSYSQNVFSWGPVTMSLSQCVLWSAHVNEWMTRLYAEILHVYSSLRSEWHKT